MLKVPHLEDEEIEWAAADLLRRFARWQKAPVRPPIPVEVIAEGMLGLTLSVGDLRALLGNGEVLGATWLDCARVMIDQSLEGKEGRFSFTLAHELGHWELHRPRFVADKAVDSLWEEGGDRGGAMIVCRDGQRDPMETQADKFAAFLLMPAAAVWAAARGVMRGPLVVERLWERKQTIVGVPELRALAAQVIEVGGFTNVSNQAMAIRLERLMLVVDEAHWQPGWA